MDLQNPGSATNFRNDIFVVDLDVICAETVLNPMQMVEQYAQFCNENEMLWMLTTRYVTKIDQPPNFHNFHYSFDLEEGTRHLIGHKSYSNDLVRQ